MRETHGTLTIEENGTKREVAIIDFIQCTYKDNRVVSVAKTEEETYMISVENPISTGRSQASMHLTKESLIGVIASTAMFLELDGSNMVDMLKEASYNDMVNYKSTFDMEEGGAK